MSFGGSRSTWKKPTQIQGERAGSTQKGIWPVDLNPGICSCEVTVFTTTPQCYLHYHVLYYFKYFFKSKCPICMSFIFLFHLKAQFKVISEKIVVSFVFMKEYQQIFYICTYPRQIIFQLCNHTWQRYLKVRFELFGVGQWFYTCIYSMSNQ